MLRKLIAIFLAGILIVLAGCSSTDNNSSNESNENNEQFTITQSLQLLYCANDTMNPYKTISKLNAELAYLLFEPLFKVDNNFEPLPVIAKSVSIKDNVCTVTLKEAVFSDNTKVTADDVLYSYNLAKQSKNYSYLFYEVESVSSPDGVTVVFTLKQYDPYFANLLTFPIIKTGSDTLKNEDNVELVPIGCGPFVFSSEGEALVPNETYFNKISSISKITLINAPDTESMTHYVEVGATDLYYTQTVDNAIIRMSGKKASVNLNNLVFLGINHNYQPLKSARLRYAISSAVSRSQIAEKAFYSNAIPANGFFHPAWNEVSGFQTMQSSQDLKISVENLENIGYNKLNTDGYYENSSGKVLELTLMVNKENTEKVAVAELIASQLKAAGIKIRINAVSRSQYYSNLENGNFQLYLGEIKLLPNMDISPLVIKGKSAAYGMVDSPSTEYTEQTSESYITETSYISVVKGFLGGKNTSADVASALLSSMPVIPLVYRNSIAFYSSRIESVKDISSCDIFLWLDKYKVTK